MKRSLLSIAAIVCAVVASLSVFAFYRVRGAIKSAWGWIHDISPIAIKQPKPKLQPALVQAKEYVTRQAKRERPTVTPRWRMCPSA